VSRLLRLRPRPPKGEHADGQRMRLLREGGWVVFGQAVSAMALVGGVRLLTEIVPPDTLGSTALLIGLSGLASNIFFYPKLQASLRFYPSLAAEGETHRLRTTVGGSLRRTAGLLTLVVLLVGMPAARWTGLSYWVFPALAGLLAAETFRSYESDMLRAARRQRPCALWAAAESVARPLLGVLAVLVLGASPQALLTGYALATAALLALFVWAVPREGTGAPAKRDDYDASLARDVRRYALPLMPYALVSWVSGISDRYLIGALLGAEETGRYAATYGLVSKPILLIGTVLELTLQPVYFAAVARNDHELASRILRGWLWATVALAALAVGAVVLLRHWIAALFLGEMYRGGADLMPWICAGHALLIISFVLEKPCYAHKRTGWIVLTQSTGAVLSIVLGIPLIRAFGIFGAALAVPMYYGVQMIVTLLAKHHVEASARKRRADMNLDSLRNSRGELWLNVASSYCVLPEYVNLDNSLFYRLLPLFPLLRPFLSRDKEQWFRKYKEARTQAPVVLHDCRKPLPVPDGSIDHILCSHFLEHVYPDEARAILADFHRVLKPGGTAHVIVPDLRYLAENYLSHRVTSYHLQHHKALGTAADTFTYALYFSSETPPSARWRLVEFLGYEGLKHRWMYDRQSMTERLLAAGFHVLDKNNSPSSDYRQQDGPISLHLLVQKGQPLTDGAGRADLSWSAGTVPPR
jgi:O-antigen/teichoic acid export membrane protein